MFFARSDWLLNLRRAPDLRISSAIHSFTRQCLRAGDANRREQNGFRVCSSNKQRNFANNHTRFFRNTRRSWQNSVWKPSKNLCLFEFIDEPIKMRMQMKSCVTLFSWHVHKLNLIVFFFYRMVLNAKRIHNSFLVSSKSTPKPKIFISSILE